MQIMCVWVLGVRYPRFTCLPKGQLNLNTRIDQGKQDGWYRADRSAVSFDWLYQAKAELRTPSPQVQTHKLFVLGLAQNKPFVLGLELGVLSPIFYTGRNAKNNLVVGQSLDGKK